MTFLLLKGHQKWIWPVVVAAVMTGCTPAPTIKDTLTLCFKDSDGASMFIEELRSIAADRNMKFLDDSVEGKRQLVATGGLGTERDDGSPFIQIIVKNSADMGLWALNYSAPGYQVRVFFLGKEADPEAQIFADYATKRLAKIWPNLHSTKDGYIRTDFNACK
jgi:hypothetical protein